MDEYYDNAYLIHGFSVKSALSPFSPDLTELLRREREENSPHLQRVSNSREGLQMAWSRFEARDPRHASLCLTLSARTLDLTVATSYNSPNLPPVSVRSTLVIEGSRSRLYLRNKLDSKDVGLFTGEQANERFAFKFNNTLINLGFREGEHVEYDDVAAFSPARPVDLEGSREDDTKRQAA